MRLPKAIKAKWLKALRSGKYKQGEGTLYNTETKGFCCLGVLEHVCMNGNVEVADEFVGHGSLIYKGRPTKEFYDAYGIEIKTFTGFNSAYLVADLDEDQLMTMNDSGIVDVNNFEHANDFNAIADCIEANIKTL